MLETANRAVSRVPDGARPRMANDDEELPDFPDQASGDDDTEVPTAPADPHDKETDESAPMNSA
jgi:hypothetical protein